MGQPQVLQDDGARALLAHAQRLTEAARGDGAPVDAVVRSVIGLQAQDRGAASLGVRARLAGATASRVERALVEERSVVRLWCMRGTLHLVASDDARWLVSVLGPVGLARYRRRHAELGVDDAAVAAVRAVLAENGPLDRDGLAAAVRTRGVRLAEDPQAPAHLVGRAALGGLVCEAGVRAGRPLYALMDDWLGPESSLCAREHALQELARRHAAAHPPAAAEDLAAWAGLPLRDARTAFAVIAAELQEVELRGRRAWVPRSALEQPHEPPVARLLPAFDGILLGHRDRSLIVAPRHARAVLPGGGVLRPTVLADGMVAGTWRLARGTPAVTPFAALTARTVRALEAEIADVVRHRST